VLTVRGAGGLPVASITPSASGSATVAAYYHQHGKEIHPGNSFAMVTKNCCPSRVERQIGSILWWNGKTRRTLMTAAGAAYEVSGLVTYGYTKSQKLPDIRRYDMTLIDMSVTLQTKSPERFNLPSPLDSYAFRAAK
jgi:hypothetical protein